MHAKTLLVVPLLALALAGCPGGGAPTAGAGGGGGGGSTIPIPPPDTNPPSAPTGFNATPAGSTSIDLDWNASTDDVGVTAYIVTRNGTQIATPAVTSFLDTGLTPATNYNYTVRARDAAGNLSTTTAASAQTAAATGDTSPPTAPTNLTATAAGSSVINLLWTASTDNVGVTNYVVRRDGAAVATPAATNFSDTGLSAATLYSYTVEARDAAGNVSAPSNGASATTGGATGTLPLGNLVHDGPATPEQISLFLPVTGALPQTATAAVRYRQTGSPTWITGHPLHRIRPTFSMTPAVGSVPDAFAWPIIDLAPGTSYDIEVTVTSGATTEVKTLTHTTRALPAAAGPVTTTILPGSTASTISSVINSSASGNVIEIPNGAYTLTNSIQINRSGTLNNPIYIRGQSRAGVVLSNPGRVFQIQNASNVVIENLTIQGSGVDSGTNASSEGISFFDGTPNQSRVTIRNVVMNGVDKAIVASAEIQEFLAYDNTLNGNNLWTSGFIDSNLTWNDDGVRIPGFGNCAFNNTLKGFGDTLSYAMHSGADTLTQSIGVHFYRNDILSGGDDLTEADHSHRNNTFYDNRARNTMTFLSLDPIYGGPLLVARNISVNTGRSPLKMNSENSGQFIYNNTIIRTTGRSPHNVWGQVQFNNGDQQSWGYRNNLLVYRGITSGGLLAHESGGNDFVDFTHNSWFPNSRVLWSNSGGSFNTIALAFAGLPATTPLFGGSTQRHFQDNITISNPWTVTVTLGTDYLTEITSPITPALSAGTTPKNTGAVIPNITDGFSGAAPDRGAIIGGRAIPTYGDRTP